MPAAGLEHRYKASLLTVFVIERSHCSVTQGMSLSVREDTIRGSELESRDGPSSMAHPQRQNSGDLVQCLGSQSVPGMPGEVLVWVGSMGILKLCT